MGCPVNQNEAEFFLLSCLANRSLTRHSHRLLCTSYSPL